MSRFYKPTMANNVDFMKQLPIEMMLKGLGVTEQGNDQLFAQTDLLGNAIAKINHLSSDAERVQQKQKGYQEQIDAVTKSLMENPEEFRKKMPLVRDLTRTLSTDMQSGELAAIQGNAAKLAEWDKIWQPQVASNKISPDAYRIMKARFLQDYTNQGGIKYDATTGNYNQIKTEDIYHTQDFTKDLKEAIDGIKANSSEYKYESDTGKWLTTKGGKTTEVSAARIAQVALDSIMADPNKTGYLRQGAKYGYLPGVADQNGNMIQPYTLDKQGNPVFNPNSFLAAPIRAAVGKYAFKETASSSSMQVDPYDKALYDLELKKEEMDYKRVGDNEDYIMKEMLKHGNQKEMLRLKSDLASDDANVVAAARAELLGKSTALSAGNSSTPLNLSQNGDLELTWNYLGGGSGRVTNDDLLKDINKLKLNVLSNRNQANNKDLSPNERGMYLSQAIATEAELKEKAELAHIARESVNTQLKGKGFSDNDLKMLNNLNDRIANVKQRLAEAGKNRKVNSTVAMPGVTSGITYQATPQQVALSKQLSHLEKLKETDSKLITDYFKKNQDKTSRNITGVGTSPEQQKLILEAFASNPDLYKAVNLANQTQEEAEKNKSKVDKFNTFGTPLEKAHPILSNSVEEMMKDFKIVTINAPTAGMPASVTLRTLPKDGFLKDNRKEGQNFVVPIFGDLQKTLGMNLQTKEGKAKQVGTAIADMNKATVLAELKSAMDNKSGGTIPAGFANLGTYGFKDAQGKEQSYNPQIVINPLPNKANPSAGHLGIYRAKISLPNGGYMELKDENGGVAEYASEDAAVEAAYEALAPKDDK